MARIPDKYAPYAFIGNVLDVLQRLRDAGLPDPLTVSEVTRVGVSEGNASRTIATLQFLGLLEENGQHTEVMKSIENAPTDEYPALLANIIKSAYRDVFKIVDPSKANDIQIVDAFRTFNPSKQRQRMVNLFIGLCQASSLMTGVPATSRREPTKVRRDVESEIKKTSNLSITKKPRGSNADKWFVELERLLERLPSYENPIWTKTKRDSWLKAIESQLDYLMELEDE
jgi:hypothetical protein